MTSSDDQPDDNDVVEAAATAAEEVVFSHYSRSEVRDLDVSVTFEDEQLDVDVYLDTPDDTVDVEQVAEDAVLAARDAVDELLE